jgi:hypothetical protein
MLLLLLLQDGRTSLYHAAELGHVEVMWKLVDAGAAMDAIGQVKIPHRELSMTS